MEDLPVLNFSIRSHSGDYTVSFDNELIGSDYLTELGTHYIVDRNVFARLGEKFYQEISKKKLILIDATEETKSYKGIEPIIEQLIDQGLKRDSTLVAIGGGITQDITCFVATTFMRGLKWVFVPTTLLAQADSCIGSKSSINFGKSKNLLGSFNPPNQVIISEQFLSTLADKDIKSGIGEIIKLYLVDEKIVSGIEIRENLSYHLYQTLQIKKRFIEVDEFDRGIRNNLNYGHCFGHAIESATNFIIPHGIAISMGMEVANRFALYDNLIDQEQFDAMSAVLMENYKEYAGVPIKTEVVLGALTKDKKNTSSKMVIILPVGKKIAKGEFNNANEFWEKARRALTESPITLQS